MINPWLSPLGKRYFIQLFCKRRRHRPPGKYSSFCIPLRVLPGVVDGPVRHGWVILVFDADARSLGNYKVYFN